jgi:hypothetical protein
MEVAITIDAEDRIVEVGGAWVAFARANNAPELRAATVAGRRWRDFVSGVDTIVAWHAAFFACRMSKSTLAFRYRCDSRSLLREFEFEVVIAPAGRGRLLQTHRLVREEMRRATPVTRSEGAASLRCPICARVGGGARWTDPFEEPGRPWSYGEHGLCPDCRTGMAMRIAAMVDPSRSAGPTRTHVA